MGITVVRPLVSHQPRPTLDDVLDHFDHVARLVGVEHVGLGSDVDVTAIDPASGRRNPLYAIDGLDPVARIFQIAGGLLERGYTPRSVELVLGGNFRRVLGTIWHGKPRPTAEPRRDPFCPAPHPMVPTGDPGGA
jgi:membrane dipeptidase